MYLHSYLHLGERLWWPTKYGLATSNSEMSIMVISQVPFEGVLLTTASCEPTFETEPASALGAGEVPPHPAARLRPLLERADGERRLGDLLERAGRSPDGGRAPQPVVFSPRVETQNAARVLGKHKDIAVLQAYSSALRNAEAERRHEQREQQRQEQPARSSRARADLPSSRVFIGHQLVPNKGGN